jgi:hypothetical protein
MDQFENKLILSPRILLSSDLTQMKREKEKSIRVHTSISIYILHKNKHGLSKHGKDKS